MALWGTIAGCRLFGAASPRNAKNPCETRQNRDFAGVYGGEAPVGVEPTMADLQSDREPRIPRVKQGLRGRCTPGCTLAPADPALSAVVEAWSSLPPAVRAGILAMVEASRPASGCAK